MNVKCRSCDSKPTDKFKPLEEVKDLGTRISSGEEVPAGECLKCGALVHDYDDYERLSRASGVLQRDYEEDVDGMVEMITDEIKAGEITDQDDLYQRMHEAVDGAQRIIYTHEAKLALVYSKNDEAYAEEFGGEMPNYSQLAFAAFHRDIQERLDPTMCEDCDKAFASKEYDADDLCEDCYESRVEDAKEEEEGRSTTVKVEE